MKISAYYKYSWFSNLAYVKWNNENITKPALMIAAANAAQRVPGNADTPEMDGLGDRIFMVPADGGLAWRVASFEPNDPDTGFAASLFVNDATGEKVLGVRGTEPSTTGFFSNPLSTQAFKDLLQADLGEIGFIGMAISQSVSLFNYIQRLHTAQGADVTQLELHAGSAPAGVNSVPVATGVDFWFTTHTAVGQGEGLLSAADDVTITGHSLGGHLAAIGQRLFPALFDQTVTYNAPRFESRTVFIGGGSWADGSISAGCMADKKHGNRVPEQSSPHSDWTQTGNGFVRDMHG